MRLGQLVVDLTPARQSRDFRLLPACRTIVLLSAGFIAVAVPVQVYRLTNSSLQGPALAIIGAGAWCVTTVAVLATTLPQLRRARLPTTGSSGTDSDVTPGTADPLAPNLA